MKPGGWSSVQLAQLDIISFLKRGGESRVNQPVAACLND
jgi:hypothetical protein